VKGALQQWLGELIEVHAVSVTNVDSTLTVNVQYVVRRSQQPQSARFVRAVP
jgi:hypothetical protein